MQGLLLFVAGLLGHLSTVTGRLTFPSQVWIEPGEDLLVVCKTDGGLISRIYSPSETVPSDEELRTYRDVLKTFGFGTSSSTKVASYSNAQEGDSGIYTCVVFHDDDGFPVQLATSMVHVRDLCADSGCPEPKTCVPDYDTGTFECECVFDCPLHAPNFLCTDTCELFFHECSLQETMCQDGIQRNIDYFDFCQTEEQPLVRQSPRTIQIEPNFNEEVILDSGLVRDGVPSSSITWSLNGQELAEFQNQRQLRFAATAEWAGLIECKITHCRREYTAIYNRYQVVEPVPPGVYRVCSVYPGGVVEQFQGQASFYDLACSHVLAADYLADNDLNMGWYVYGTFDEHDGAKSLSAMTFYVGSTAFEFQRGWVINVDGEKFVVEEGVGRMMGDSGCLITYTGLHLRAECPHFHAYYDGVMSGHIRLGGETVLPSEDLPEKRVSQFGLCWDNDAGFRTNWRLRFTTECAVDGTASQCPDTHAQCGKFAREAVDYGSYSALAESGVLGCGAGSKTSCAEMSCGEVALTAAQRCSLNQAHSVNCLLKVQPGFSERVEEEECPAVECEWKLDIVSRGCPQKNPPFQCK